MSEISEAKLQANRANLLKANSAKRKKPKSTDSTPTKAPPPKRALFGSKRVETAAGLATALGKFVDGRAALRAEIKELTTRLGTALQEKQKSESELREKLRRQRCYHDERLKRVEAAHVEQLKSAERRTILAEEAANKLRADARHANPGRPRKLTPAEVRQRHDAKATTVQTYKDSGTFRRERDCDQAKLHRTLQARVERALHAEFKNDSTDTALMAYFSAQPHLLEEMVRECNSGAVHRKLLNEWRAAPNKKQLQCAGRRVQND